MAGKFVPDDEREQRERNRKIQVSVRGAEELEYGKDTAADDKHDRRGNKKLLTRAFPRNPVDRRGEKLDGEKNQRELGERKKSAEKREKVIEQVAKIQEKTETPEKRGKPEK